MKSFKFLACLALASLTPLCLGEGVCAQSTAPPETDFQSWNDLQLTIPMSQKVDFVFQETLRIGGNISKPVDERIGIGWVFKIGKYLTFNPSYLHREARAPRGNPESEERVTLGATVRFPLGKFTLSDRNLFERRFRVPQGNSTRYRNRLQVEHSFKIDKQKFTFFVTEEVFYDWSVNDWVRNRFGVGVSHTFNKHFTLDLYYLRQNEGRSRPGDINIIGTTWKFRL
jgi:hypothetical protein